MPLLRNPTPPRLPDPGPNYTTQFMAALLQVLRLYFSQLTSALGTLMGTSGATFLATAYGLFRATTTQTAAAANTAYAVTFASDVLANSVTRTGTQLTVDAAGIYRLDVLLQLVNTDAAAQRVSVWAVVAGVAAVGGRVDATVPATGRAPLTLALMLPLLPGEAVEIFWSTENTAVSLTALAAAGSPTRPASASATVALTFVSATNT